MRFFKFLFLIIFLFLLNSCIGLDVNISFNQNGSGILNMEYTVSKALDSLGKLDGNERWNTIPIGKADFERTMERLTGIKLLSYSSKENDKDLIIKTKMEFADLAALGSFFDAGGFRSSFNTANAGNAANGSGSGQINLKLSEGNGIKDSELSKLISSISDSYSVKMSVSFPKEGKLSVFNGKGIPITLKSESGTESKIVSSGKTVSFSFPLYDILSSTEEINAEFSW